MTDNNNETHALLKNETTTPFSPEEEEDYCDEPSISLPPLEIDDNDHVMINNNDSSSVASSSSSSSSSFSETHTIPFYPHSHHHHHHHYPPSPSSSSVTLMRCLYFTYNASNAAIIPFLPVYFHSLSMSHRTIGTLGAMRSGIAIVAAPFWGYVSDGTGRKWEVLMVTFVVAASSRMLFLFAGDGDDRRWYLFVITVIWSTFHAPTQSLLDHIVVSSFTSKDKSKFGRYRLWGKIANGISSATMGALVYNPHFGFPSAFVIHFLLSTITTLLLTKFRLLRTTTPSKQQQRQKLQHPYSQPKQQQQQLCNSLSQLISNHHLLFLLLQVFFAGAAFGIIGTFCYVQVREQQQQQQQQQQSSSSGWELGLCRICLTMGGVTMYYHAGSIHDNIGAEKVMIVTFMALAASCYFYVWYGMTGMLLPSSSTGAATTVGEVMPLMALLMAEVLRGGTFAVFWSTVTIHVHDISPTDMCATMLTLMESIYRGFGHTAGALLGGILVTKLGGITNLFRYVGVFVTFMAVLSIIVLKYMGRRK